MGRSPTDALRVALMTRESERGDFRALLEREGVDVVLDCEFDLPLPGCWNGAQVLLVGIPEPAAGARPDIHRMQRVLQQSPLPVLLNRGGLGEGESWNRRLIGKLRTLAGHSLPGPRMEGPGVVRRPSLRLVDESAGDGAAPPWVVLLGGSIGAPAAVARFLGSLPDKLPLVLLIAQHVPAKFECLLAEQLDRCSAWPVALADGETRLRAGHAWLVPAGRSLRLEPGPRLRCLDAPWPGLHQPDIDQLLSGLAMHAGPHCGVILFSGLGEDGAHACHKIRDAGGFVWTQHPDSCAIANLPEAAARHCAIDFSAAPEELARRLAGHCHGQVEPGLNG